jgi:hypothetical protein
MASSSDRPRRIFLPIDAMARSQLLAKELSGKLGDAVLLVAWLESSAGGVRLFVVDPSGKHAYLVDPAAIPGGIRGLFFVEVVGDFAIAPSLMLHDSVEVRPSQGRLPRVWSLGWFKKSSTRLLREMSPSPTLEPSMLFSSIRAFTTGAKPASR